MSRNNIIIITLLILINFKIKSTLDYFIFSNWIHKEFEEEEEEERRIVTNFQEEKQEEQQKDDSENNDKEEAELKCGEGKFYINNSCLPCPHGSYVKDNKCLPCGNNMTSFDQNSTSCMCEQGFYQPGPHSKNYVKSIDSNIKNEEDEVNLEEDEDDKIQLLLKDSCIACPKNSDTYGPGNNKLSDCLGVDIMGNRNCPPGFHLDIYESMCRPCPIGTYSPLGNRCIAVKEGEYTNHFATAIPMCLKGYYRTIYNHNILSFSCEKCPPSMTTNRHGIYSREECFLEPYVQWIIFISVSLIFYVVSYVIIMQCCTV